MGGRVFRQAVGHGTMHLHRLADHDGIDAVLPDLYLGHHLVRVAHVHDAVGRGALPRRNMDVEDRTGDRGHGLGARKIKLRTGTKAVSSALRIPPDEPAT